MIDREERALLVVPYRPGPPPRSHFAFAVGCALLAAVAGLLLLVADYSAAVVATLAATTTGSMLAALALTIAGMRARGRFRAEMEPAAGVTPAAGEESPARSERVS